MKGTHLFVAAAIAGALALPFALAGPGSNPGGQEQEGGEHAHEGGHELHHAMESLQRNMKRMRKLMSDPSMKDDALAACSEMEDAIRTSLAHAPTAGADGELEGTALVEYQVGFKRQMLEVYGTVLELEVALDAGDGDAAKKAYRKLGSEKKSGHDEYMHDDH